MANRIFSDVPKDSMFVNCFYTFSEYNDTKGEYDPDSIIVVHKDKDGNKGYTFIEKPNYTYYITKDIEKQFKNNKNGYEYRYISLKDVVPVTARYSNRYRSMAEHSNRLEVKELYNKFSEKGLPKEERRKLENMHLFNEFHSSDVDITDYYIDRFIMENNQEKNSIPIDISTFDIEVDGADYPGFPNEDDAPCEVNMITYYNFKTNRLSVFMKEYDTDTFEEFINDKERKIKTIKEVKDIYREYFGDFSVKLYRLKSELDVIKYFFMTVNKDKPDYCCAWNARFDIFTLKNRLDKILVGTNMTAEDIMCPSDFCVKKVVLRKDDSQKAKNDFTARTDTYNIYGYTTWLDMMVLYGNITRPQGKKESYSLNAIGLEETGLGKENLSEENTSIKTVFLDNYTKFFKYSCIDTLLLSLIVKNTGYIDLLHTIVTLTHTRASKALTKTVCLRNYVNIFYREMGYVISNNRCRAHNETRIGISGAYVAPPELIDNVGEINGIPSNKCFDFVIDEDLSAMYPNILITFNISSSTALNRIIVSEKTGEYETVMKNNKPVKQEIIKDITKEFMEKFLSEDSVRYCVEYHNLPDYEEMYNLFKEE
jgi:hypothetical protein